jgi:hypothetical protein
MTPAQKRLAFPLRAPRWQTLAWSPWHIAAAAVDGYYEAFFAVLPPIKTGSRK